MAKFSKGDSVHSLHERAKRPYGEYLSLCEEVETVYRGAFALPKEVEGAAAEPGVPSEGFSIIDEIVRTICWGNRTYDVPQLSKNESTTEGRLVDRAERFLQAYLAHEKEITLKDNLKNLAWMAALRGQGFIRTLYEKGSPTLPFIREVLDPLETFPVWGRRGVLWYTTEKTVSRWELMDYFGYLPERTAGLLDIPDLKSLGVTGEWTDGCYDDQLTITEYWDDKICAWEVGGHLVQETEHNYDRITLRVARFGQTPDRNPRWAVKPLLAPIKDDLKQMALMLDKIGVGVEMYTWPLMWMKDESGAFQYAPSLGIATDKPTDIGPGGQVGQVTPQPNHQMIQQYMEFLQKRVNKATVTDLEQTKASGFAVQQWLNTQRDRLRDYIEALQLAEGQSMGDVLYLHELFDEGDGWDYFLPDSLEKRTQEKIKAEDIAGHHQVVMRIKPSLPTDLQQEYTALNQLYVPEPSTGKSKMSWETAMRISGLAEKIPNLSAEKMAIDRDWLTRIDPEIKALEVQRIKAENAPYFEEIKKTTERLAQKQERKAEREAERAIERGMSEDVLLPAEVMMDPQKLDMFTALIKEGKLPSVALKMVTSNSLPMGVPGQQPQQMTPENQALIDEAMAAMNGEQPQGPNGLTGYDGMNPMVQPAAMAGAEPRMAVDRAQVQVEQADELQRRGGLPAPA